MARSWRQRCCWSITAKPLLIVSLQGVGAGGGVSHALGMPGAPPLREGAADEVTAMIVPPAVGVGHADGQRSAVLGSRSASGGGVVRLAAAVSGSGRVLGWRDEAVRR